jgi:hypothetical protein
MNIFILDTGFAAESVLPVEGFLGLFRSVLCPYFSRFLFFGTHASQSVGHKDAFVAPVFLDVVVAGLAERDLPWPDPLLGPRDGNKDALLVLQEKAREAPVHFELYRFLKNFVESRTRAGSNDYSEVRSEKDVPRRGTADLVIERCGLASAFLVLEVKKTPFFLVQKQ